MRLRKEWRERSASLLAAAWLAGVATAAGGGSSGGSSCGCGSAARGLQRSNTTDVTAAPEAAAAASATRWRVCSASLSSGRYNTLLPLLLSTNTLVVFE